uniref:Calcium load-activated calcium channel n=1 Tax=Jaculus jaculus TaxID=51337 RepID=A0A8C5KID4_JACJA
MPPTRKCGLCAVKVGVLYSVVAHLVCPGLFTLSPWRVGVRGPRREMSTMFADTLLIVFISVCTALLAEGITWVLVYRTDKYKRLKAEVEKQSKKLEKKKETITESAGRQQKKKIERQEEKLKNNNRDLSMVRMKSMFAIGFCFTALMGMFNSISVLTMFFSQNIQKILGLAPSRAATKQAGGFLGPPPPSGKFS